jgi:hypothetical protein
VAGILDQRSFDRVRRELKQYVQHQLDLFSWNSEYADYFSTAEYADVEESISEDEAAVFQSTLAPEDRGVPLDELHPREQLNGLRAVILRRIGSGNLEDIRAALYLFDGVMESGIPADDTRNPRSYIRIETASEFVPWFV